MSEPQAIEAGQVWRHHTTGDWRVQYLVPMAAEAYGPGMFKAKLAHLNGRDAAMVWLDYLRANFTLVTE